MNASDWGPRSTYPQYVSFRVVWISEVSLLTIRALYKKIRVMLWSLRALPVVDDACEPKGKTLQQRIYSRVPSPFTMFALSVRRAPDHNGHWETLKKNPKIPLHVSCDQFPTLINLLVFFCSWINTWYFMRVCGAFGCAFGQYIQ